MNTSVHVIGSNASGRSGFFNPLVTACAVLMLSLAAVTFSAIGFNEQGIRLLLRMSARVSFALFCITFIASPLHQLIRSETTAWLQRQRRSLGLAFALAHGVAGAMIICYASQYNDSYYSVTYPLQRIGGTVGFLAIATMVVTSFEATKRWMTYRTWKVLHSVCLYFICINYLVSFGRRTILNHDGWYAPFLIVLLSVIAIRVGAACVQRRSLPSHKSI